jgi:hypothetical protein
VSNGRNGPLATAVEMVGLLAGIVVALYVLGGTILALRLLFDGFAVESVVALLGQLPREFVISTGVVQGIAPATVVGLIASLAYGVVNGPKPRGDDAGEASDHLTKGSPSQVKLFGGLAALALLLVSPAVTLVVVEDGVSPELGFAAAGLAVTYAVLCAGWFVKRRIARKRGWYRLTRALAAGAVWAAMALVPAVMAGGASVFEDARVCMTDSATAITGSLIGDTSERVILVANVENEENVMSLPAARVSRVEYGDLVGELRCPPPDAA